MSSAPQFSSFLALNFVLKLQKSGLQHWLADLKKKRIIEYHSYRNIQQSGQSPYKSASVTTTLTVTLDHQCCLLFSHQHKATVPFGRLSIKPTIQKSKTCTYIQICTCTHVAVKGTELWFEAGSRLWSPWSLVLAHHTLMQNQTVKLSHFAETTTGKSFFKLALCHWCRQALSEQCHSLERACMLSTK